LPVADVDCKQLRCASLEQAVGEAAGGSTEVCHHLANGVVAKRIERACELDPTPRNIGVIGLSDFDRSSLVERFTALVDAPVPSENLAREGARPLCVSKTSARTFGTREDWTNFL
jgi:hypothetical protein